MPKTFVVSRRLSAMLLAVLLSLSGSLRGTAGEQPATGSSATPRILTRIFFQDEEARVVKWADVLDGIPPRIGPVGIVDGFPQLDPDRQKLVQMEQAEGMILAGVRDDADGGFQSGWVLIETGVEEEDHGDHADWRYRREPRVRATLLDDKQGNPAHLYCYKNVFYLANDKLDGYTRLDPSQVGESDDESRIRGLAGFHRGGGGHITLAVTDDGIGYSAWIDRRGENSGRVDVTATRPEGNSEIGYSFHLPHGGIHGATYNQGKVFFAPSDGICWVAASSDLSLDPDSIEVHHLSLGEADDKPVRTGAFTSFEKYVAFTTGSGPDAALNLIDASAVRPQVIRLPIAMAEGNRPAGLAVVRPRRGSPLAFVFHDHAADVEAPDLLSLVELDPNGDASFADARIARTIEVGPALVEGHGGHHSIDFDGDRRRGVFGNPGEGTLVLFSLAERKPIATFSVGGIPSKVITVGGRNSDH